MTTYEAFHYIVSTDWPAHSHRNENINFNQNYPFNQISQIQNKLCTKEMVFQQSLLEKAFFIAKMSGPAMVRPASSDFWKAPLIQD